MSINVELINPFIKGTSNVLEQFGIIEIKKGKIVKKNRLDSKYPVTIVVGIVGELKGNITYNLSLETSKKLVSAMMMGMEVVEMDEMAKSALSELSNMITGNAASIFESMGKVIDISPPTLITGKNIIAWISQVETIALELVMPIGIIELNIGLEI
ncbi:chemotaxis protein CheX [Haliovirga abyssi]|uniref:Chemotaxis protein CheX n=1 Tax=Haliovirga abyssi TaxID=2996794 RepID=A0AAU9D8P0_9FUSO|nr:chemotaxis protein CheX [Haliovirga abyssi]BDU49630.1 chemotaxis protein CheX [Haliovirga abyssi]